MARRPAGPPRDDGTIYKKIPLSSPFYKGGKEGDFCLAVGSLAPPYTLPPTPCTLFPRDSQLLHQLVERRAADAQILGGAGDVFVVLGEHPEHHLLLQGLTGIAQAQPLVFPLGRLQLQIAGRHLAPLGHDDGAFHPVFQLAHVSRPVVILDGRDGIGS